MSSEAKQLRSRRTPYPRAAAPVLQGILATPLRKQRPTGRRRRPSCVVRVDARLLQNLQGDGLAKHAEANEGVYKLLLRDEGRIFLFASLTSKLMPFRSVPLVGKFGNLAELPD